MRILWAFLPICLLCVSPASALETAVATRQATTSTTLLDGLVEPVNRATVSAQTSGRITALPFDVDDAVEAGQVIVRFEATDQTARRDQAAAVLNEVEAVLIAAQRDFERMADLVQKKLASRADLDRVQAAQDAAKARQAAAKAGLVEAQQALDRTVVTAPFSGIVLARHVEVGELATVGQPLMTGMSLDELRVVADVPQSRVPALRSQPAATLLLSDGRTVEATDVRVFPYADPSTHTVRIRAQLPEQLQDLYPGALVKLLLPGAAAEQVVVPSVCVAQRGEVTALYVKNADQQWQFRQVRIGHARDGMTEVLAGLDEGEEVALDPVAAAAAYKAQFVEGDQP